MYKMKHIVRSIVLFDVVAVFFSVDYRSTSAMETGVFLTDRIYCPFNDIFQVVVEQKSEAGELQYEYDDLGRVTKVIYPDGAQMIYEYDENGNLLTTRYIPKNNAAVTTEDTSTRVVTDSSTESKISADVTSSEETTTSNTAVEETAVSNTAEPSKETVTNSTAEPSKETVTNNTVDAANEQVENNSADLTNITESNNPEDGIYDTDSNATGVSDMTQDSQTLTDPDDSKSKTSKIPPAVPIVIGTGVVGGTAGVTSIQLRKKRIQRGDIKDES